MWYIGTIRIFTQELEDKGDQTIARLGPLGGGTTLHFFGYEDLITNLGGYVVGMDDRATLISMYRSGAYYTLETPWGTWGDYAVRSLSIKPTNMICQTLRPDLDEDAPVFDVSMELYKDE